jgi:hypothetical protein
MFVALLRRLGLRGWALHTSAMGSVWLCLALWIRAKTVDQMSRANAEHRAIFVGLWAPVLWLIGDALERAER